MEAVALERSGDAIEAMQMYRRAVHLDSEIEFKMYDKMKTAAIASERKISTTETGNDGDATISEENISDLTTEDLILRFTTSLQIGQSAEPVDDGVIRDNSLQLLCLPMEILVYILRWVVSSNLDTRSLEQCSMVCKSLYLCSRQSEIWRLACKKCVDFVCYLCIHWTG